MAVSRLSVHKQSLTACALISATLMAGCSSVERTPMEQLMAAQTVTPLAKPGTEMTAYALPTPDGAATTAAAALAAQTANASASATAPGVTAATTTTAVATASAEAAKTAPANPSAMTALANTEVASLTPAKTTTSVNAANPLLASTATDALPETANAMITVRKVPVQPTIASAGAMDSDFDTGEPVGLETLVAKRMIVPAAKPQLISVAYSKMESAASALLGREKPTSSRPELDKLITHYAKLNGVPEELVHRVVRRESTYNPRAYHNGNYGLMQIRYNTAKGLGYDGPPEGLFDAETNLKYATQYLRGAWVVAENQNDNAVKLYASGYYYHAKRKGLLDTLGMR
ncbi:lytic transglycosylase domain-containing protein [Rhizobium sp. DKSPLA3]|uniref:Lytic transglycosylase domain-containing protein n=1 Tax=Rhizobium quercicola TaxID=2901226 RepID=A0A9X1NW15_9HYPH|nr:lytic transglycosylase domain-containing protein [Rhizobium quercicola]MCD7110749.1 lytic transglycosylase domain-containing protein [Rhizobium quercicola]